MTYLEWLKKEGFALESSVPVEDVNQTWVRPTKYGAPKCHVNKAPVNITITKVDDRFVMGIQAATSSYWGSLQTYDLTEEFLVKRGRALENRMVAAWMELSS